MNCGYWFAAEQFVQCNFGVAQIAIAERSHAEIIRNFAVAGLADKGWHS